MPCVTYDTADDLAEPFGSIIRQLLADSGGRVCVTSGRRTYDQQVQARRDNGCADIFRTPASQCRVPTAIPGTSKHESGEAVDLNGDLAWVRANASRYGIVANVAREPWHWELDPDASLATIGAIAPDAPLDGGSSSDSGGGLGAFVNVGRTLLDTGFWLRLGVGLVGIALIGLGLFATFRDTFVKVAGMAASAAKVAAL